MKNYRMFECKYLPVTDTKPMRMRITDTRFNKSVVISRRDRDQFIDDCIDVLTAMGITLTGKSWNEKTGMSYLFTEDFDTQLSLDNIR